MAGVIKPGGNTTDYLGHFRNADVMKRGHNFGFKGLFGKAKDIAGGMVNRANPFGGGGSERAKEKVAQENVRRVAKSGVDVNAAKNPILAAKVAKREAVQAARATGGDVSAVRKAARESVKEAKQTRAGFSAAESKAARQSYKQTVKSAGKALTAMRKGR